MPSNIARQVLGVNINEQDPRPYYINVTNKQLIAYDDALSAYLPSIGSGIDWNGPWVSNTSYSQGDVVSYNGSSYYCISAISSAVNPSIDTTHWGLLASSGSVGPQGATGPQGPAGSAGSTGPQGATGPAGPIGPAGLNWQGAWSALGTYVVDDAVGYGGASYFCIGNVGPSPTTPDVDTANWALLAAQGAAGPQGPIGATGAVGPVGPAGPQGPAGTSSVILGNAVYVSTTGNDSNATRNNIGLPYLTIEAALANALTGDTIVVFPGYYELLDQLVLRDDIHFEFLGEGLLRLLFGVNKNIFQDTNGAVSCNINAPGWTFEGRGVSVSQTDRGIIKLTNASNVVFNAYKLLALQNCVRLGTGLLSSATIPSLTLTAHTIQCTSSNDFGPIYATSARLTIKATDVLNANSNDEYDAIFTMRYCPYISIKADRAINAGIEGQVVYIPVSNPGDVSYIDIDYMKSGTGWTVWVEAPANEDVKSFITSKYIESKGDCVIVSTHATLTITGATIYNDRLPGPPPQFGPIDGILHAEYGGSITAINCVLRKGPTTTGPDVYTSGGKLYLVNTTYNKSSYEILPASNGEIFNWDGTDFVAYKEISVSSLQLLNSFTSPILLLDNPGLGQYYKWTMLLEYTYNTVGYTADYFIVTNGNPGVIAGATYAVIPGAAMSSAGYDQIFEVNSSSRALAPPSPGDISTTYFISNSLYHTGTVMNDVLLTPVFLQGNNSGGNPTDGDGTFKVKIWYRLESFSL